MIFLFTYIYIHRIVETRSAHVISELCLPGAPEAPAFLKLADACLLVFGDGHPTITSRNSYNRYPSPINMEI